MFVLRMRSLLGRLLVMALLATFAFMLPVAMVAQDSAAQTYTAEQIRAAHGTLPRVLSRVDPVMPGSVRGPIDDKVSLSFVVDEKGRPTEISVAKSMDKDFDREAVKALSQYRFEPGTDEGHPVRVRLTIDIRYMRQR